MKVQQTTLPINLWATHPYKCQYSYTPDWNGHAWGKLHLILDSINVLCKPTSSCEPQFNYISIPWYQHHGKPPPPPVNPSVTTSPQCPGSNMLYPSASVNRISPLHYPHSHITLSQLGITSIPSTSSLGLTSFPRHQHPVHGIIQPFL